MTNIIWTALPSFTALSICLIFLLIPGHKKDIFSNNVLAVFFSSIFALNIIEFLTLSKLVNPSLIFFKAYYVFMLFTLTCILIFSLSLTLKNFIGKYLEFVQTALIIVAVVLAILTLGSNLVLSGFTTMSLTVTRIPGDYYFVIQLYFLICLTASIALLLFSAFKESENKVRKRAKIILLSLFPMLFSLLSVLVLMKLGYNINASFIFPLTTVLLMSSMIFTESDEKLFKILIRIPFSNERNSYLSMVDEIESFIADASSGKETSLKTLTASLESKMISVAVQVCNGSQSRAANLLQTSASSICRKKKSS